MQAAMKQHITLSNDIGVPQVTPLTGIRGVAALYVVFFHFREVTDAITTPWTRFMGHGYLAVDLFFMLSGFLMFLTYAPRFQARIRWSDYHLFILRRFARIYPMYLLTLLAAFYVERKTHGGQWKALAADALLIQNYGYWPSLNYPSWSISTEWGAYLVFPFLARSLEGRWCRRICLLACLIIVGTVYALGRHSMPPVGLGVFSGPTSFLRCLAEFSIGMLVYRATSTRLGQSLMHLQYLGYLVVGLIIFLLFLPGADLLVVTLFPCLLLSLSGVRNWVNAVLGSRPIEYLGAISYSLYLLHTLLFPWFNSHLDTLLHHEHWGEPSYAVRKAITIPLIILASAVTYHGIELPSRKLLRTLFDPRRPTKLERPAITT
jgi:peptidoglycan/LPS O-acetylase OafA/YrhL